MRQHVISFGFAAIIAVSAGLATSAAAQNEGKGHSIQLGPRPFFLVNDMQNGRLKQELLACSDGPFKRTDFSIGHRGAALQFPEHTREAYERGPAWAPASSSAM